MKNGMSKMQQVSLICDREINILACCTPKVSANSGIEAKLLMNGLAKPLVIWRLTPSIIEKTKKIAISLRLNKVNAFRPKASTKLFCSPPLDMGHEGRLKV